MVADPMMPTSNSVSTNMSRSALFMRFSNPCIVFWIESTNVPLKNSRYSAKTIIDARSPIGAGFYLNPR